MNRLFYGVVSMMLAGGVSSFAAQELKTGKAAMGDYSEDAPGVRRKITIEDLPKPFATESVRKMANVSPRPDGALPKVPDGFVVELFATGFKQPRVIVTAPNGDLLVADSETNEIHLLRDADGDGKPEVKTVFATGLKRPFGIAFYPVGPEPQFVYVGNTDGIVRFPYRNGDVKASGKAEKIASLSSGGQLTGGGHWTRDLVFSKDGKTLFASVGSKSNIGDDEVENDRARIFRLDADGKNQTVYATGIRNPVGLAIDPATGALWTSVNERDGLGDDLVPDYITKVKEGGFYGWPWYYLGNHPEPRMNGKHPELANKVIVPDVLIQSHSASLDLAFYDGKQFPEYYQGGIFACEHGSWNREKRTGYKVIYVPVKGGAADGTYEDFMTGFVTAEVNVWGRPVGVTVGKQGDLYVTDDGSKSVWRITYRR